MPSLPFLRSQRSARWHLTALSSISISQRSKLNSHRQLGLQLYHYSNSAYQLKVDITAISMPSLSPTMSHGTIAVWKANPGDELRAGDVLCEIETDKASVGFELQDDSVLAKVLVKAQGEELACGEPIALMVEDVAAYEEFLKTDAAEYQHLIGVSTSTSAAGDAVASPPAVATTSAATAAATVEQRMSPAAKHMAASFSLDTSRVRGSERGGLISKSDLVLAMHDGTAAVDPVKQQALKNALLKKEYKPAPPATTAATPATPAAPDAVARTSPTFEFAISKEPVNNNYQDIPNTNMRKVIAKRLTQSKATVPHFYSSIECEIDSLMRLRKAFKADFDINVSVNDLVIKSAALALRDVPEANAKWGGSAVDSSSCSSVDISVAVATPNGLITPILAAADKRGLADINAAVRDLAARARDGKLKPEEYQGGSFSISNLGMFGISSFSAVINPPQACILAVGAGLRKVLPPSPAAVKAAAASGEKLQPRLVTTVTVQLSSDRRVVDEAIAAQFLQVFQSYLSNPNTMLL